MLATLLLTVLTGVPAAPQDKKGDDPVAAKLDLLSRDETYRKSEDKERELAGKLVKGKGAAANPYRMQVIVHVPVTVEREVNGKKVATTELVPEIREEAIYVGAKAAAVDAYVGRSVKLIGKSIKTEVGGKAVQTFWPGRLELWDPKSKPEEDEGCCVDEKDIPLKIYAKAAWPFADQRPTGDKQGQQFVLKSAAELVGKSGGPGEQLTADIAKLLKVDGIDWKKQMLVVVTGGVKATGGWKIDVAGLTKGEKTCTVSWSLEAPGGAATQAFTHPAVMALVDRCDSPVNFVKAAVQIKPATPK